MASGPKYANPQQWRIHGQVTGPNTAEARHTRDVQQWIAHEGYDGEVPYPNRRNYGSAAYGGPGAGLLPHLIGGYGPSMPFGVGYKRKYGGGYGRNVRARYNRPLGILRGRVVRRYGSGRGPFRTGGFNAIRAGRSMLNTPAGRPERKFLDTTIADDTSINNAGTFILLNGMAQGTSQSTRIGNKFTMVSIQARFAVYNGTTQTGSIPVRVMVFYDTQANAAAPTVGDLLSDTTAARYVTSPMNLANRDRFRIIYQRTWIPGMALSGIAEEAIGFHDYSDMYKKIRLDTVCNNTSGGTVADIQSGSLYCLVIADSPAGTGSPRWQTTFRLRYVDY